MAKLRKTRDALNDIVTENDQLKIEVNPIVLTLASHVLIFLVLD